MRTEGEIGSDICRELEAKERYYKDHPDGHDGTGGFYCDTSLNLLYAEMAQVQGISDPEEVKGRVAQWLERLPYKQEAPGPIPGSPTIKEP